MVDKLLGHTSCRSDSEMLTQEEGREGRETVTRRKRSRENQKQRDQELETVIWGRSFQTFTDVSHLNTKSSVSLNKETASLSNVSKHM